MAAARLKTKSLSGRIFRSVLAFTLCVIAALGAVLTAIYYWANEREAEQNLMALAEDAADYLNATETAANVGMLESQFAGTVRYTLIATDGTVLYDSAVDWRSLPNHANRPEVQAVAYGGARAVSRYSETLGTDTVYAAVKLTDGSVVRLSETRRSLLAFFQTMVVPMAAALVLAAALVFVLSRRLTRRIMKPLDAMTFDEPLNNDVYEEMNPLLERIDAQQRQLKEQNKELALAESMRRDFSANVSHEMKTPLQVISGYAELMKSGMVAPEDNARVSGLIYEEAQAMRSLIDDVLMLSRLDESAFEHISTPIDLLVIARRAAERLEPLAADRGIVVHVEGVSGVIAGSEALAEEMLHNLIENGIRYNNEGGRVEVSVGVEDVPRAFVDTDRGLTPQQAAALRRAPIEEPLAAQRQVVVRVRDTGPGIPPALQGKVFERFFRLEKSRSKETGGTGLGLAIVKHAVLYHSGEIDVESQVGKGTTFILRFRAL